MTDFDKAIFEDLEDFESDDLEDVADADTNYLDSMWSGQGFRRDNSRQLAEDTVVAHGMVQSFVNAFARDGHYVVAFDSSTETAGTDMDAKHVVITPAPITDTNLTAEEAGRILTGLAVHEISHPRYGRRTANAVRNVFPGNQTADRLSNLLDDIRIERRFVADYPGYAGIFAPVLDYVGSRMQTARGGAKIAVSTSAPVNLAIAATRYPTFAAWTEDTAAMAAWFVAWADRWAPEDAPKRHVEAIREALAYIASAKSAPKPSNRPTTDGGNGTRANDSADRDDNTDNANAAGNDAADDDAQAPQAQAGGSDDATDDAPQGTPAQGAEATAPTMSDEDLNDATRNDREDRPMAACSGSAAVEKAAIDSGETTRQDVDSLRNTAEQILEAARNLEDDGHGTKVDVARSTRKLGAAKRGQKSDIATRYIRNAILRSRTGNTAVTSFQKRGRLDQSSLNRLAFGDARIFENRKAPSPGKYNVWVMVDCSGSMSGEIEAAAAVANAMASATTATPSVRMAVWGWSSPFRRSSAYAGVAKVWETGMDTDEVFRLAGLQLGGTPDSAAMSWAGQAITKATRADETPVIIFISDGSGDADMNERVAEVRKAGVKVFSVSFGRYFTEAEQVARFGRGNCIPFAGSIQATARPLAELFAKVTSGK